MKLTILQFITPSRLGGAELYLLRLIDELRAAGHRVLTVTKEDTPLGLRLAEDRGVELHSWRMHGKIDPVTVRKLCRLVRAEKVDLINTHLSTASFLGGIVGKMTGVPSVARVPSTGHGLFFRFADQLIAVSEGVKRHLVTQGFKPEKIRVLYNGVNLEKYKKSDLPMGVAKERLGLPREARTVGVVANLDKRKGHCYLLDALKNIAGQAGDIHAVFAGGGDQEEPLRRLATSLGLDRSVHFLGFCRDVREVLSACDVFVLPSLKEGLSNAAMEAMAMCVPVIATNVGGMAEVIHHEVTGLLIPPADSGVLAEALIKLFDDSMYANRLASSAREFVEQHFDSRVCLTEVEMFFQEVVRSWPKYRSQSHGSG